MPTAYFFVIGSIEFGADGGVARCFVGCGDVDVVAALFLAQGLELQLGQAAGGALCLVGLS